MRDSIEDRLTNWAETSEGGSREPTEFLDAVKGQRRRRNAARAGIGAGVMAIGAALAFLVFPGGAGAPSAAPSGPIVRGADTVRRPATPAVWTLASLSRRVASMDLSEGWIEREEAPLIPGRWSMGWASGPPL